MPRNGDSGKPSGEGEAAAKCRSPVPRARRSGPARLAWQQTGWLRVGYLECYDREDEAETMRLLELAAPMARTLDRDIIRALARQSGLDRLQAKDGSPNGVDLLRQWVELRRRVGLAVPLWQMGFGGAVPDVEAKVEIALVSEWRPWEQSRAVARRDLLRRAGRAIDIELARIETAAIDAGYLLPDTASQRRAHLDWLFLRVRHRMSWTAIADRVSPSSTDAVQPETIRRAVERLAPLVGVDISGI